MKTSAKQSTMAHCVLIACAMTAPLHAGLINNGGFESGLTGWTIANQTGSDGQFVLQTGTLSPVNGFTIPLPPEGVRAAMTDSGAGGSHLLYQDFLVPSVVAGAFVNFSLFINNGADRFATPTPAHLDFATPALNQQVRVDIMRVAADPFSVASADVLQNLYQTQAGDPLLSGYTPILRDITGLLQAHTGETLRLRFAEVDNVSFLNLGVDAVDINVSAIPEPSTGFMILGALLAAGFGRRLQSLF